jgi:hypothetical protein
VLLVSTTCNPSVHRVWSLDLRFADLQSEKRDGCSHGEKMKIFPSGDMAKEFVGDTACPAGTTTVVIDFGATNSFVGVLIGAFATIWILTGAVPPSDIDVRIGNAVGTQVAMAGPETTSLAANKLYSFHGGLFDNSIYNGKANLGGQPVAMNVSVNPTGQAVTCKGNPSGARLTYGTMIVVPVVAPQDLSFGANPFFGGFPWTNFE